MDQKISARQLDNARQEVDAEISQSARYQAALAKLSRFPDFEEYVTQVEARNAKRDVRTQDKVPEGVEAASSRAAHHAAEELGVNGIEAAVQRRPRNELDVEPEEKHSARLKKLEVEPLPKHEPLRDGERNQLESDEIFTATQTDVRSALPPDPAWQSVQAKDHFYRKNPDDAVFEDKGNRLATKSSGEAVSESMVRTAEARGWDEIKVSGSETFRREVWLEAASRGMRVKGYSPSEQDNADLAKRSMHVNVPDKDTQATHGREEEASKTKLHSFKNGMASIFANESPQEAVKRHPELAAAVAVVSAIDKKVEADGLNERQRSIVIARVRQNVVNSIERGELPEVKLRDTVQVKREAKEEVECTR